jgi:hypothetical protein
MQHIRQENQNGKKTSAGLTSDRSGRKIVLVASILAVLVYPLKSMFAQESQDPTVDQSSTHLFSAPDGANKELESSIPNPIVKTWDRKTSSQFPRVAARGPIFKVGAGYSLIRMDAAPGRRINLSGFELDVTTDFLPRVGIKAELGYSRASSPFARRQTTDTFTYLLGPVFYAGIHRNFRTYIHILIGGARVSRPLPLSSNGYADAWANEISVDIGGGAEFRISGPFYFRVGSDYLHTKYINSLLQIRGQNDFRAITGLVYVFGSDRKHLAY